jgi:serine/threonine protein phosphatase PrpC
MGAAALAGAASPAAAQAAEAGAAGGGYFFVFFCVAASLVILMNAFFITKQALKRRNLSQLKKNQLQSQQDSVTVRRRAFGMRRHRITTARSMIIGTRKTQQDAAYVSEPVSYIDFEEVMLLGVLCDGMGGMKGGERASSLSVDMLKSEFEGADEIEDIPSFFRTSIEKINDEVYFLNSDNEAAGQSGTTLTSVIIKNNQLYWASVGDSRIYIFRKGEFLQLTRDHNYLLSLWEMVRSGEITEEDALSNPSKDALISYIGMETIEILDIGSSPFELSNGDIVLLCSDGLTKALSDTEIARVLTANFGDLEETARQLPLAAYDASLKSLDNTSVVMFQYYE